MTPEIAEKVVMILVRIGKARNETKVKRKMVIKKKAMKQRKHKFQI